MSTPLTFTVTNRFGVGRDVTASAIWKSTDPKVFRIDKAGQGTAIGSGSATVTVSYGSLTRSQQLIVSDPLHLYRLSGTVLQAGRGLYGATIKLTLDSRQMTTVTDYNGMFFFVPVFGHADLTVSQEGFQTVTQSVDVSSNTTVSITLLPTVTPADITGTWQMAIQAPDGCAATLPADAQSASFSLGIVQVGTYARIMAGWSLDAQILDKSLTTEFFYDNYYGPAESPLTLKISPTRFLLLSGALSATVQSPTSMSGTLDSTWRYFEIGAPGATLLTPTTTCAGPSPVALTKSVPAKARR
jgi:hypothetical protein